MSKATKKKKTINIGDSPREEALAEALKQIEKQFGQGAIMKLGEDSNLNIEAISTGSISLDMATGIGGVPKGRIVEVYGAESSGKTTLTLHMIAEAQKDGGRAAFIDAEHALDPEYAKKLGVDIEELLVSQPDTGDQGLEICEMLVRSGALDLIVIDSVAALVPKSEIEGSMGDSHMGVHARLMSQALRKLTSVIYKTNCTVVFINQLREKLNTTGYGYGTPETTTGGRALKFYSTMRFEVKKIETLKQGDKSIGSRTRVKIAKNKVAPPFKLAEFDIMYGEGISREGDALDIAVDKDIIKKSGSWYSFGDERIGQGRETVKTFLKENPEIFNKILNEIYDSLKVKTDIVESEEDSAEKINSQTEPHGDVKNASEYEVDEDGVIIE